MEKEKEHLPWLDWAIQLQTLSQNGLAYTQNPFDRERFARIREIAAEIIAYQGDMPKSKAEDLFCNEIGYQTPKLDTRAAIFQGDKILLVKEGDKWSLPGGWVDVDESIYSNTVKEVKEEAGLAVRPQRLIAVHDADKHNGAPYIYKICKVFVLCKLFGGEFKENMETQASAYFHINELPPLHTFKNTEEQIQMCLQAKNDENWRVPFD